jgi:hypothetical protein
MKTTLLLVSFLFATTLSMAQCEPMFDFGEEPFGVMPDTIMGFVDGEVGVLYTQQIDVKIPTDGAFADAPFLTVDSVSIITILGLPGGLTLDCAENTSTACTYLGGSTGCAVISGVPFSGGEYELGIVLNVYANLSGFPTEIPYQFDGYSITIDGPVGVEDNMIVESIQLQPNPANNVVNLVANTTKSGNGTFMIFDLVGKQVHQESVQVSSGTNTISYNTNELPEGIYICKFEAFGESHASRLVVVH